jgi:hypothetical protein
MANVEKILLPPGRGRGVVVSVVSQFSFFPALRATLLSGTEHVDPSPDGRSAGEAKSGPTLLETDMQRIAPNRVASNISSIESRR